MAAHRQYCFLFCSAVPGFTRRRTNMHFTKRHRRANLDSQFVSLGGQNYTHGGRDKTRKRTEALQVHYCYYYYSVPLESHGSATT